MFGSKASRTKSVYIPGFHLPCVKDPPLAFPHTECALLEFKNTLLSHHNLAKITNFHNCNLTTDELSALKRLTNRSDLVICQADNNLGTVILDTSNYIAEGHRQLADQKFTRFSDLPLIAFLSLLSDKIELQLQNIMKKHSNYIEKKI